MKQTIIAILLLVVLADHTFSEPVADPEPWLGEKAEKYCIKATAENKDPNTACRSISNQIIAKLNVWCKTSVDSVCSVAFGFKDKCRKFLDKHICPAVYDGSPKRPWLENKIEKLCIQKVKPSSSENNVETCKRFRDVFKDECVNVLKDACEKIASVVPLRYVATSPALEEKESEIHIDDGDKKNKLNKNLIGKLACKIPPAKALFKKICG